MKSKTTHNYISLGRRFLIKAFLLVALVAFVFPGAAMAATVRLTLNAADNGYKLTTSSSGTDVECANVHESTDIKSALLNGEYEVTVTTDFKEKITRTLTFKDGNADFGDLIPRDMGGVAKVSVNVP